MDKLNAAYQEKKVCLKLKIGLKSVDIIKMSEEKDDLRSIKVYKCNNTKENWHEFALKFRVIADSRGYYCIIDGTDTPPDEKEVIEILADNEGDVLKAKKDKLVRRCRHDPDEQMDRWMCSLGVCSYVLEMLEVVNLARN